MVLILPEDFTTPDYSNSNCKYMFLDYQCGENNGEDGNIHFHVNDDPIETVRAKLIEEYGGCKDDFLDITELLKTNTLPCCSVSEIMHHKIQDGKIVFCPIKAKRNFINKFRTDREQYFKKLDASSIINIESGLDNSNIIRQKNLLRNMTVHPIWDTCKTLDDFKNITMDSLLSTSNQ